MRDKYDVIIVGGGPAGIFAALEFAGTGDASVLLLEKGRDIERRICPISARKPNCVLCAPCSQVSGWGGAGAFSDGKLTLSTEVGGRLPDYVGQERARELIEEVDQLYLRFGAPDRLYGVGDEVERFRRQASLAELRLIPVLIRHLGTERCGQILKAMRDYLKGRVDLAMRKTAKQILVEDGAVAGITTNTGEKIRCRYLIVGPGREGADWLTEEATRLKLHLSHNPVDVGVRVEVAAATMAELTDVLYESKLEYYSKSFDDRVRSFCMCPAGEVIMECTAGHDPVVTVNGHSYENGRTDNTNFALLVSTRFTEPFREPIAYGRYIARLANIIGGGVIVQRLGDLMEGRRSTPERIARSVVQPTLKGATPGDLSFVLPYRYVKDIIEMLLAMDKLSPGVASRHTLLYGVEVKFYSSRLQLTHDLETEIPNLFAIGDGAGVTRGLVQASASGLLVAREIQRRLTRNGKPSSPVALPENGS
ncbi:MAG: FAD-binding protein [Chloroflexota bacterium]|nr:MAG: FAD-binding protein [Chloroflexota bacterium]